jgi:fructokinase
MAADMSAPRAAHLDPSRIVAAAARGDGPAEETLRRYERRMARALAAVINVLDPTSSSLAVGMSNIDRLYTNVPKLWGEFVFAAGGDVVRTLLVRAKHGDASGVRGAHGSGRSRR